jgi:hypothetical protein
MMRTATLFSDLQVMELPCNLDLWSKVLYPGLSPPPSSVYHRLADARRVMSSFDIEGH